VSIPHSVKEAYNLWWTRIAPAGVSAIQTEEMRRAFYSGAYMTFMQMVDMTEGSEGEAMAKMSAMHNEFRAFHEGMRNLAQQGETAASQSTGTL
jgi:hypothetical protein